MAMYASPTSELFPITRHTQSTAPTNARDSRTTHTISHRPCHRHPRPRRPTAVTRPFPPQACPSPQGYACLRANACHHAALLEGA